MKENWTELERNKENIDGLATMTAKITKEMKKINEKVKS